MSTDFTERVVVVTGASRGIGREIADGFAGAGAKVAAISRSSDDLAATVEQARTRGGQVEAWPCDVTQPDQIEATLEEVRSALGPIDVLVNNAGQRQDFGRLDELAVEEWRRVVEANLSSVFYVSRAAVPDMIRRGSGSIVNIASIAGPVAFERIGAYCAAKAGVTALTKVMAAEWTRFGIRVNAVAPGWIESPMNYELRTDPKSEELLESIKSRTLLGRFGLAREVAAAVLFLASPGSAYVVGATLFVDGGWTTV